ncbi:MAG: DUF6266 family protein [Bacteroidales bacterium]|nr:DUF6266 family protein [Bacteroidales bacterium]
MAISKDSLLEGFCGSIGKLTIIAAEDGKTILKRRIGKRNRSKMSDAQRMQQARFKMLVTCVRSVLPYVRYGYAEYGSRAYAKAVSENKMAVASDATSISYADIKVAHGSMAAISAQTSVAGTAVTFKWDSMAYEGMADSADIIMPMVYNTNKSLGIYSISRFTRADGMAVVTFPEIWKGDTLALYIAVRNADATKSSDSTCLGQVMA